MTNEEIEEFFRGPLKNHPSRELRGNEWDDWANSPEGILEILKHPSLGWKSPWYDLLKKISK